MVAVASNPAGATPTKPLHSVEQIGDFRRSIPPGRDSHDLAALDVDLVEEREEQLPPSRWVTCAPRFEQAVERQRCRGLRTFPRLQQLPPARLQTCPLLVVLVLVDVPPLEALAEAVDHPIELHQRVS